MTIGASLLLAAVVTGAVDVSDRSEIRIRDSGEAIGTTFDVETAPAIGLRLRARAWAMELGYGITSPAEYTHQAEGVAEIDELMAYMTA